MRSGIKIGISIIAVSLMASQFSCDTKDDFDVPDREYFVKYYGTSNGDQTGVDMVVNADGTVTMVGKSESGGVKRIYFVKVDGFGNLIAEKYLGGPSDEVKDIEPLGNDYVILSNYNESPDKTAIKIIRVDSEGTKVDSVVHGEPFPFSLHGNSITILASNAGFMVAGRTEDLTEKADEAPDPDLGDFSVFKFTDALDIVPKDEWYRTIGWPTSDEAVKYFQESDTSGLYIGFTENVAGNLVLRYSDSGETGIDGDYVNHTPTGSAVNDLNTTVLSAVKTNSSNPGYLITGVTVNASGGNELFICKLKELIKFNDSDVQLYTKFKPLGSNQLTGISATSSSAPQGYLVVGNDLQQSGNTNIWLSKLDLNGQVIWSASFGAGLANDVAGAVTELEDGRILVLGTVELGDNQTKLSLIKLNSRGLLLK